MPNLPDLVRFRLCTSWLQIEDLFDAISGEDVMTASNSLLKAEPSEQITQIAEANVGVGRAAQYPVYQFIVFGHPSS